MLDLSPNANLDVSPSQVGVNKFRDLWCAAHWRWRGTKLNYAASSPRPYIQLGFCGYNLIKIGRGPRQVWRAISRESS